MDSRALADTVTAGVAEDFVPELALARTCSEAEASALLREALLLTGPLSPVWSALHAGRIGPRHAAAAADLLGDATPEVAAAVQARVLPSADGLTATVFRDRLRYHLYRVDAAARERRRKEAAKRADVHITPKDEGLATLGIDGTPAQCLAARGAIDALAQMLRNDGDTRPIGVLRAAVAFDLIMRPWDTSRPPVTAHLVLHAAARSLRPDGDPAQTQHPGELDGQLVSAAECRDLLRELGMIGLDQPPAGGTTLVSIDDPVTGETIAVATPAELQRAAGLRRRRRRRRQGTGRVRRRPTADLEPAAGPGLRLPPDTNAYQPTARQQRHVHVRDRRCRMPGCRRRRGRLDLDHGRAHGCGGPTACWNLCCLCRRHHRIKTLAPGWYFELLRDGRLIVRTPAGITRETRPPGWCHDPEPDPPWLDETAPPDPLRT